jgi:hypothetical protein
VLEEPAEPLPADDLAHRERERPWLVVDRRQRHISHALMRAFLLVMGDFPEDVPEVLLPAHQEVVQALAPHGLNEPLEVRVEVRGRGPDPLDLGPAGREHGVERGRKLGVVASRGNQPSRWQPWARTELDGAWFPAHPGIRGRTTWVRAWREKIAAATVSQRTK